MTSKAGRAAYAIKSGTVAAGMAVGNTLAYVAPQLAGAIDIVVVRQPDGSLKSSPFYVRFGKYTGMRSDPNKVAIFVNDKEVGFCMHMGRTGEAYFIVDAEPGDQAQFPEALNGLMSPVSGYSSDQEPIAFPAEQSAAVPQSPEDATLRNATSTPAPAKEAVRPRPGPVAGRGRRAELDSTLSAPANLEMPGVATIAREYARLEAPRPLSEAGEGGWPQASHQAGTDLSRIRSWNVEHPENRAVLHAEQRSQNAAGSLASGNSLGDRQDKHSATPEAASPPGGKLAFSPRSSSSSLLLEEGMFSPLRPGVSGASSPQSGSSPGRAWHWDGRGSPPYPGLAQHAAHGPGVPLAGCPAAMRSASRPPQHPWSVGNPRLLPSPLAAQPQPAVMSSADAATPVHGATAGQGHLEAGATAILPRRSLDETLEPGRPRLGGRLELEALEQRVGKAHQPAPLAVAGVAHEVDRWHGSAPRSHSPGMEVAEAIDHLAGEQAAAAPSVLQQSPDVIEGPRHLNGGRLHEHQGSGGLGHHPQPNGLAVVNGDQRSVAVNDGPRVASAFSDAARGTAAPSGVGEMGQSWPVAGEQSKAGPLPDRLSRSGKMGFGSAIELSAEWRGEGDAGPPIRQPSLLEPFAEEEGSSRSATPLPPAPEESPGTLGLQGRASQVSEATGSSLPIGIPGQSSGSDRYTETWGGDRPLGGSLPAGAFGMSPTESAKYLGNASDQRDERILLGGLPDVELSLCASSLQPGISPQEAWERFEAGRISRSQYEAQGLELVDSPELMVRLGKRLLPWRLAGPVLLGMTAFGSQLEALDAGLLVEVPQQLAGETKKEAEKRSGWRVWLKSWRSRRESHTNGLQPLEPDGTLAPEPQPTAAPKEEAREELLGAPETEGMLDAGKRVPGKRRGFCPSSKQLGSLQLSEGQNTIDFVYGKQRLSAYLYYFRWNARLVISDVDGTITRSDLLGHVLPRVGFDWSHPGINRFFSHIEKNGYHILFLSSRAIAQASATRDYLHSLNQDGHKLPCGPVIISPDGLFPSLYRELVLRRPHEFKIRALEDIRALFPPTWNPFFCGFGNRDTDEISYLTVGVPASKIFIINPKGELRQASSAVVTSTWNSLTRIVDIVNEIFPPCQPQPSPEATQATPQREEYSDYNYWHVAPPIIVDSDDEVFGDPDLKGLGDSEEEETEEEEDDDSVAETPVGFRAWP